MAADRIAREIVEAHCVMQLGAWTSSPHAVRDAIAAALRAAERRGAERMRERCAALCSRRADVCDERGEPGDSWLATELERAAGGIALLPLEEPSDG
jgi:hypothetical protein